jgi:K(+)-stimulated pyrophosphate-energized sodium pump
MNHCGMMGNCNMEKCMTMTKQECAAYCDSMQCSPEQKAMCQSMYDADGKFDMAKCKAMCKESAGKEKKACCAEGEENGHDKK